jgi:hypothetical protein
MADESPSSYKMFFQNLNIVSTYLLPLSIFSILFVPLTFYAMYRNSKYSADKRTVKTESFSSISK